MAQSPSAALSGIASAAATLIGRSIVLSNYPESQQLSPRAGIIRILTLSQRPSISSNRPIISSCAHIVRPCRQSLPCLQADIANWGSKDTGALCEVLYQCKEAEQQLSLSEETVIAERSRIHSIAVAESLRRAHSSQFQPKGAESNSALKGGQLPMGSPAGPKMLELERRHSGASQASSRAGRRPDASSAAASLQQRLSAGQQSVARISPLGGAVAKSDQMQGGVERRRSSSTAVLRVLQHCQELEEDLAARNWMQVGGESGRSQTGGSEDEFKRNGGDRMSSGRGGAKGGRAESMGASQDETGWNAGKMGCPCNDAQCPSHCRLYHTG